MALAFPDLESLKSLQVPDSRDIIVNGQPSASFMHLLNELARRTDLIELVELLRAYEPPP